MRQGTQETQESDSERTDQVVKRKELKPANIKAEARISQPEQGITKKLKTLSINALRRTSTLKVKPLVGAENKLFNMQQTIGKGNDKLNLTHDETAYDIKKKSQALQRDRRTCRAYVNNPR